MTNTHKQNRRRLITALRSGQYPQGVGGLRSTQGYCCQGVACDLSGLGTWQLRDYGDYTYLGNVIAWPRDVMESLGFDHPISRQFMWMNDGGRQNAPDIPETERYTLGEPCTFEEIADCMELLTLAGL